MKKPFIPNPTSKPTPRTNAILRLTVCHYEGTSSSMKAWCTSVSACEMQNLQMSKMRLVVGSLANAMRMRSRLAGMSAYSIVANDPILYIKREPRISAMHLAALHTARMIPSWSKFLLYFYP